MESTINNGVRSSWIGWSFVGRFFARPHLSLLGSFAGIMAIGMHMLSGISSWVLGKVRVPTIRYEYMW